MPLNRELAASESLYLEPGVVFEYAIIGEGSLDVLALQHAFEQLLIRYPVLDGSIQTCVALDEQNSTCMTERAGALPFTVINGRVDAVAAPVDRCALSALTVVHSGQRFRAALFVHHVVADAHAAFEYFEALWKYYAAIIMGEPQRWITKMSVPRPIEDVLCEYGINRGAGAPENGNLHGLFGSTESVQPDLHAGAVARLRLTEVDTLRLGLAGKRAGLTVHGVVCAAALLTTYHMMAADALLHTRLHTVVDIRNRLQPPVRRASEITNALGGSLVDLLLDGAGAPADWGRRVLAQLRQDLQSKQVHRNVFRYQDIMANHARRVLAGDGHDMSIAVSNWGMAPRLPKLAGIRWEDFQGSQLQSNPALRNAPVHSPPIFYVAHTFAGRLGVDIIFISAEESAEWSEQWRRTLQDGFYHLLADLHSSGVSTSQ